jgi:hypothetical protein
VVIIGSYAVYIVLTLAVTIWVARTLHRNGRVFLVDSFHGHEALADSVNHLLVVGFYLINVGYIALVLQSREKPDDLVRAIELLSHKIGIVLIVLGIMHFINIKIFSAMRRRAIRNLPPPPVQPDGRVILPTS